ncbi:uncharacterized protein DDB_G0286175-like [Chenopodium quinoa]|uniref:uncharacterized protein DDB_G0286175-like n=1 Tax=Chenopodium quinoa TaxID=63459 RepID=UPI000B786965|nr:uncharacterized protein DDB_G0286175-like [Chenopodium quinoa]
MVNLEILTKFNPTISCFRGASLLLLCTNPRIKLILCEGNTKVLKGRTKIKAGEIMFEFPDCVVCHADSFILGRPIPVLAIHDYLVAGRTYFVLPLDRLPRGGPPLSAASLQSLSTPSPNNNGNNNNIISSCPSNKSNNNSYCKLFSGGNDNGNKSPFEYIKDKDGRVLMIKVVPEFITRIITANNNNNNNNSPSNSPNNTLICTTPELQKQYEQLVRAKDQGWSPKLETISEHKMRASPTSKLLRLEWIQIKLK